MKTALLNNRYRLLETLGRGGFGQTFLAVDTHMPSGRKCVIKELQPSVQDLKMQQWVQASFQREAATLEDLGEGHSQIPRLYAYFCEADTFYLVQEWIEGVTLAELRKGGTLSEDAVTEILINLLPVLDYIHSRGIVHRDLKPDNIILRAADRKPVLIDFGAVKEAIATVVDSRGQTALSIAVGTPGYMPSEQAAGRPLYSSDLYSLGLTAVYLLTGHSPQELETDPRTGEILWRKDAPIHSNLAAVIDRAIRFHPRDRFASAPEMLAALSPSPPLQRRTLEKASLWQDDPGQIPAATSATRIVSPQTPPKPSPPQRAKTSYAPAPRRVKQGNGGIWALLLLLAGIGGIVFAIGFNLTGRERSPVASSPELIAPAQNPSPEPQPEVTPEPAAAPDVFVQPTPEPSVSPAEPTPEPQPQVTRPTRIPAFAIGTTQEQILGALGEPTKRSQGYWPGSRAWLYKDFANQTDLGYLFDETTGRLRQTEVSFDPSVDVEVLEKTLNGLTGGNTPETAREGLRQIYQRQNDLRSFEVGNLKGMIQRNQQDRIYIGVWDADFH